MSKWYIRNAIIEVSCVFSVYTEHCTAYKVSVHKSTKAPFAFNTNTSNIIMKIVSDNRLIHAMIDEKKYWINANTKVDYDFKCGW